MLTKYKNSNITYDEIGNPLNYRDRMTMSWSGRELAGIKNGLESYTYAYNLSGLRTSKTVHGTSTNYYYDGNDNLISTKRVKLIVMFYYDSNGEVYSMSKGDKTYFFIKNHKGDIMKIIDKEGNICATYSYDAWGAILEENEDSSIKGANPFRYRGYVYDTETGLYYLQSRYYDPQTGRFINADDPNYTDTHSGSPLSTNMFAYCENNHTMGYDPSGNWGKTLHGEMCKSVGFSKTTCEWVEFADGLFSSDGDYSAPFHSRARKTNNGTVVVEDGLQCAKYLYNLAIDLRSQYRNGKDKSVKFDYAEKSNTDNVVHFKKKYLGFLKKVNGSLSNKVSTDCNKAKTLLSKLNGLGNRLKQADALLGLSLHILQDYYAHRVQVKQILSGKKTKQMSITALNHNLGWATSELEDRDEVLPWRIKYTRNLTGDIYWNYYTANNHKGRKIKNISLLSSDLYEKTFEYKRNKNSSYKIKLRYVPCSIKINW